MAVSALTFPPSFRVAAVKYYKSKSPPLLQLPQRRRSTGSSGRGGVCLLPPSFRRQHITSASRDSGADPRQQSSQQQAIQKLLHHLEFGDYDSVPWITDAAKELADFLLSYFTRPDKFKKLTNKQKRAISAAQRKINQLVRDGKLKPRGEGFIGTDRPSMASYALGKSYPPVLSSYSKAIDKAKVELGCTIGSREKTMAPLMLDLAWHAVFGVVNGFPLSPFKEGITVVGPIKKKFPALSGPDIYQLAGVVAVEATGGPSIQFNPGREETRGDRPPLRDACKGIDSFKDWFHHMEFSNEDIVALMGRYTLGRWNSEKSHYEGAWAKNPFVFDNSYYNELLLGEEKWLQLEIDKILLTDPEFRPLVEKYAYDEASFFEDYAEAHLKFSELGFADV